MIAGCTIQVMSASCFSMKLAHWNALGLGTCHRVTRFRKRLTFHEKPLTDHTMEAQYLKAIASSIATGQTIKVRVGSPLWAAEELSNDATITEIFWQNVAEGVVEVWGKRGGDFRIRFSVF